MNRLTFRYDLLNRHEIKIGELEGIVNAAITHDEHRVIKRTATFIINENFRGADINYLTDRVRPWLILPENEYPLGIFLLESPSREVSGATKRRNINAYDKTLILDQYILRNRQFFPKGTTFISAVERLIAMAGISRTNIAASDMETETDIEFPVGTNVREAVNTLLEAVNFTSLSFNETGVATAKPYVFPAFRTPKHFYSTVKDSTITPGIIDTLDIASIPNVFIRVADNVSLETPLKSEFVNDNPALATSTVNRGRQIINFERVSNVTTQAALDTLVKRAAIEATQAYRYLNFTTLLTPNHGSGDTLYIDMPELFDAPLKFCETGWSMELKAGGKMTHTAQMVVEL